MKNILKILILISLLGCKNTETDKNTKADIQEVKREYAQLIVPELHDTLIMISTDDQFRFDSPCAFVNAEGDTVIPFGKFNIWDSVNFYTYAIVKSSEGIVGINRNGEVIFDAYLWGDAQLEEISEGLFRVKRNGKIGFANKIGKVVIPCQFGCAQKFENGEAKVSINCSENWELPLSPYNKISRWTTIDTDGKKIK